VDNRIATIGGSDVVLVMLDNAEQAKSVGGTTHTSEVDNMAHLSSICHLFVTYHSKICGWDHKHSGSRKYVTFFVNMSHLSSICQMFRKCVANFVNMSHTS